MNMDNFMLFKQVIDAVVILEGPPSGCLLENANTVHFASDDTANSEVPHVLN